MTGGADRYRATLTGRHPQGGHSTLVVFVEADAPATVLLSVGGTIHGTVALTQHQADDVAELLRAAAQEGD